MKSRPFLPMRFFNRFRAEFGKPVLDLDGEDFQLERAVLAHGVLPALEAPLDGAPAAPHQEQDTAVAVADQMLGCQGAPRSGCRA